MFTAAATMRMWNQLVPNDGVNIRLTQDSDFQKGTTYG
jgi:hypothetical protein